MNKEYSQNKYEETLQKMKEERMNWDFENFIKQTENKNNQLYKKNKNLKYFWLAAGLTLFFGLMIWNFNSKENEIIRKSTLAIKKNIENPTMVKDTILTQKDSVTSTISAEKEAEKLMNQILPKRNSIKKTYKKVYAQHKTTKPTPMEYDENFVTINGEKIQNKEEAIRITQYSLQVFSDILSQTVASIPISNSDDDF